MISIMNTINKNLSKISRIAATVSIALFLAGCSDNFSSPSAPTGNSVLAVASAQDSLKAFVAALNKTGLNSNFDNVNGGVFTIFGPSNFAFVQYFRSIGIVIPKVDASTADDAAIAVINSLTYTSTPLSIPGLITRINYHIISSNVPTSLITGAQGFTTMQGARLSLSNYAGATYPFVINANVASSVGSGANIVTNDLTASNGIVHIVDRVMAPISVANIWDKTLLNFSINYAVSPIVISMFSSPTSTTLIPLARDKSNNFNVSTAPTDAVDGNFNLFSAALIRANLATVINPNGATILPDFTVFAVTDGAFKTYLNVTTESAGLTAINALDPTALAKIINYHIVSGRILTTDLTNGQSVNTLAPGATIKVNVIGAIYTLTDLNSTSTDATLTGPNKLSNAGIVHAINQVLLPN
jgi:transforming growth factor-beta-induced protein